MFLETSFDIQKFIYDSWNQIVYWFDNVEWFRNAVYIAVIVVGLIVVFKVFRWLMGTPKRK